MLKKAGIVAAAAAAGFMTLSAPAFAGTPTDMDWNHHHHGAPHQVGLVNLDDIHFLNDVHVLENVNVPVCASHINVGLAAVDALNPTFIKDCVDGAAISHSGDHHGG